MQIKVLIPGPLQRLTEQKGEVEIKIIEEDKITLAEVIERLERMYPGIKERLYDESGKLRRFINIFINQEDIRFLEGEHTLVKGGDEVLILPAIAGGANCSV